MSPIVNFIVNSGGSFLVAPDGSKEGWSESDHCDDAREKIRDWLASQQYSDGSNALKWFEAAWPEDKPPTITHYEKPAPGTECYENEQERPEAG